MKSRPQQQESNQNDPLSDEIVEMFEQFMDETQNAVWSSFDNCRFCQHSMPFGGEWYCTKHDKVIFDVDDPCEHLS